MSGPIRERNGVKLFKLETLWVVTYPLSREWTWAESFETREQADEHFDIQADRRKPRLRLIHGKR